MFSKSVIDTDQFIDMPKGARLLYYDLGMRADDDGFVGSVRKIMKIVDATEEDLSILIEKGFVINFKTGVIVITHWKMNNYIQADRYKKTNYQAEINSLSIDKKTGIYRPKKRLKNSECIQVVSSNVSKAYTQDRLGKVSIGKNSIELERKEIKESVIENDIFSNTEIKEIKPAHTDVYSRKNGTEKLIKLFISSSFLSDNDDDIPFMIEFLNGMIAEYGLLKTALICKHFNSFYGAVEHNEKIEDKVAYFDKSIRNNQQLQNHKKLIADEKHLTEQMRKFGFNNRNEFFKFMQTDWVNESVDEEKTQELLDSLGFESKSELIELAQLDWVNE